MTTAAIDDTARRDDSRRVRASTASSKKWWSRLFVAPYALLFLGFVRRLIYRPLPILLGLVCRLRSPVLFLLGLVDGLWSRILLGKSLRRACRSDSHNESGHHSRCAESGENSKRHWHHPPQRPVVQSEGPWKAMTRPLEGGDEEGTRER